MATREREEDIRMDLANMRNPYLAKEFDLGEPVKKEVVKPIRKQVRKKKPRGKLLTLVCLFAMGVTLLICLFNMLLPEVARATWNVIFNEGAIQRPNNMDSHPEWVEDYLTPNEYSRPGDALPKVDNIFVHYTANPGTSAAQNRSYFEQLKDTRERSASAHFIIGYEGEIILCVPLDEIAYAVKTRNYDSISIECCYLEENGAFTRATYDSLVELLTWLLQAYDLEPEDILRHYDCGGKKCPLYYVENEDEWEDLKADVGKKLP